MNEEFLKAVREFNLHQSHNKIYTDPNELITNGFSADFLLPLVKTFKSTDGMMYLYRGNLVDEMIGISHLSLVCSIGKRLGVPPETGSMCTGRGFAMEEIIEEIMRILEVNQ